MCGKSLTPAYLGIPPAGGGIADITTFGGIADTTKSCDIADMVRAPNPFDGGILNALSWGLGPRR